MNFKILLLAVSFLVVPSSAFAQPLDVDHGKAMLTWDAPTTNVNGTPLTDLAGYGVYWRIVGAESWHQKDVDDPMVPTYTIDGLTRGETYEFYVTAVDTSGNESDPSNVVIATIPLTIPDTTPSDPPVLRCEGLMLVSVHGDEVQAECAVIP